jgi:hypothetical protein
MGDHGLGSPLAQFLADGLTIIGFITGQGFKPGALGTGFASNGH